MGVVQPDRTTSYNREYWNAVTKDIGSQMSKLRFPSRPAALTPFKAVPGADPNLGPYKQGNVGKNYSRGSFAGKRLLPGE